MAKKLTEDLLKGNAQVLCRVWSDVSTALGDTQSLTTSVSILSGMWRVRSRLQSMEEGFENEAEETDGAWLQRKDEESGGGTQVQGRPLSSRAGGGGN